MVENPTADALVEELAKRRGVSEQDAVRQAVAAELQRLAPPRPLAERLAEFRAENPLPPLTGLKADKAFFDELSDEP